MIPWPLGPFQKPIVSAPVLVLHTVTVTWFDEPPPMICAVLLYDTHAAGGALLSVIVYVNTPHCGEARLVTPQPGLPFGVVVVTLTVPSVALHPLGYMLLCTLSVMVSVLNVYGAVP